MTKEGSRGTLRLELERNIRNGRCAYCRRPAAPDEPLTREHVVPRAKGGRRKDVRIIVPACARCNHRRGCQELALFLLLRPRRIAAFLDYLSSLSPESIQQMDLRVFAELYAALWLLGECSGGERPWRVQLRRLCSGRTLHRRRYAARRVVGAAGERLERRRERQSFPSGPSCLVLLPPGPGAHGRPEEALEQLRVRLLSLLALVWRVPAEEVLREIARLRGATPAGVAQEPTVDAADEEGVLPLDGWKRSGRRRRLRVDRRNRRGRGQLGGRAA